MLAALLVALAAMFAGVAAARGAARAGPRVVVVVVAGLLAVPWCLFAAYYLHVVDIVAYFEWRSHAATDLLAGLVGFPVGVVSWWAGGARRGALALGIVAVAGLWLVAFAKPLLRPLPPTAIHERVKDGVCLQSTPSTCGPCAAATVLQQLGHVVGEAALAQEASSTTSGTLSWLLVRALRDRGFDARFTAPASVTDITPPAIIGVHVASIGHFVALLGIEGDTVVIGEPLTGLRRLPLAAFSPSGASGVRRSYVFDHFAIEVSPAAQGRMP